MNVLHVNHSDHVGGAAIAAVRLARSLASNGLLCRLLVRIKISDIEDIGILTINNKRYSRIINAVRVRLSYLLKRVIGVGGWPVVSINIIYSNADKVINKSKHDIVHLHWIGHETLTLESVVRINGPVVWTLHDNWLMQGFSHIPAAPESTTKQGISAFKKLTCYFDHLMKVRKEKVFSRKEICIIAPSQYMYNQALSSSVLGASKIHIIPNAIDTDFWREGDMREARSRLNVDHNVKMILFGLYGDTSVYHKGFDLLLQAIKKINKEDNSYLLGVFGSVYKDQCIEELPVRSFGFVDDERIMRDIYRSSDVYVMPSRVEPFGQTAAEAMSCGIPVVAFNNTGPADFIKHKKTGWLATQFDTADLAKGIEYCLCADSDDLSTNSRNNIIRYCSNDIVAKKHIDLYKRLISKSRLR